MDLVTFLAARLDEDEAAAKAVAPLGHVIDMGGTQLDEAFSHGRIRFAAEDGRSRLEGDVAAGRHFARHDPARVLREVEAGRKILAEHGAGHDPCDAHDASLVSIWCNTLRYLAAVYSDHPDCREEWKP